MIPYNWGVIKLSEANFSKLISKINKLLVNSKKIKEYHLSDSGWEIYFSNREREKLEQKANKAINKKNEYMKLISDTLNALIQSGFSKNLILSCFDLEEDKKILSQIMVSITQNENNYEPSIVNR